MKIKLTILFFITVILSPGFITVKGQEKNVWSLEDCVRYAHDNNIRIKQQELNSTFNENTLKQSQIDMAPNLNAGMSHAYTRGRALDESTYRYTSQDQNSQNYSINSNVTLFNGLQKLNTVKQNRYNLLASVEDVQKLKDDISVNIALSYLQILLNRELLEVADNQLMISHLQIERTGKLVDAGSLPVGNLLEITAQAAMEEMQVVGTQNQLYISYLTLTQILDFDSVGDFEIEIPDLNRLIDENYVIPPVAIVFNDAVGIRPEIKGAEFRLRSSEQGLKIAKGARSPRISLNGTYGTLYSDARKKITIDPGTGNITEEFYPFREQLSDNKNIVVSFGLSVPVFNSWMVNTNISNAKLNIQNYQYELRNTKNELYKEIQQAYADAFAAMKKFRASEKAVTSMVESFRYTEQKYNVGLVNSVDYNTAKNQLTQAQSELLQAKYEYIFYINVLEFYRGNPIIF
jgi:outer membrane protein